MKVSRPFVSLVGMALAQLVYALPPMTTRTGSGSFPTTSGVQFVIDGEAGYFPGSNSYWIGFLTNDRDVDLVFDHMRESGLRVLRVWGFNDVNAVPSAGTVYFQLHQNGKSTINTGKDGLQRLDYVVQSAEKRGVKLIINFVNYWNDYGGMNAYVQAYGGSSNADFYASDKMQAAYRAYINAVVSRYIDSPAVFAWELANEPRCKGCNTTVLHDWIARTSQYIKSLDSKHMVCIGDEGFGLDTGSDGSYPYGYSEGSDFAKGLSIDTIDFGTFHLYPGSWGTTNDWGNGWVASHGAACEAAGKPCLFEEYGVTSNHCAVETPWQTSALNTTAVSADLYWQYGDTLSTGKSPDDGNTFYYGTEAFECLVTDHVAAINAKSRRHG
ncbi:hypothetical protein P175DRAFT_0492671 [Aspergillus ochraceoroseus IBT 24754]|uniref:mannan endo-1,4-beta-mannosidase n=2 Tax=Aspergillus ochraceoroseus TaxID=138278 RepID=A0A2T5M0L7_9EURO|nr:uncharacterized protein P175DRAFT_0492671 [Aspergillus ochraceoroseus IBT 24754]KKK19644.1 mannan endo-1,4-beta-mannosidase F [Aspergillus ochraceoroseus]PTU22068.1 hypothetical protein P175DRAFT_0492671 [Aspergillus ochraceoroseus IBT 24754]